MLMKMMYLLRHTDKNSSSKIFLKVSLIIIVVLVFVFAVNSTRSLLLEVLSPLFKTGDYFYRSLGSVSKIFSDKNKIIEENARLSDEIENYRISAIDYESVKYENQKLREDLKIKPTSNFITSSVLARSPQIPLDSLFLDKGIQDGINNGDFVLASDRILIGKIVEASKNRSTVALNSFVGVISYGYVARTNEPLETKGAGGGAVEANVPIDFDIIVGDKVMVGGSLSYLAAIVGSIEEDRLSGFKNVLMSLPVDISKINSVFTQSFIGE